MLLKSSAQFGGAREEWARVPRGRGLVVVDLELRLHDPGLRFTPPSSAMAPF
jgi:hypothetical protein